MTAPEPADLARQHGPEAEITSYLVEKYTGQKCGMVSKMFACEIAWRELPPGQYTVNDIADKANKLRISEFCYRQDAGNAVRRMRLEPAGRKPGAKSSMQNVYKKEATNDQTT